LSVEPFLGHASTVIGQSSKGFLFANHTLRALSVTGCDFDEASFKPIADGLMQAANVTEFGFDGCNFVSDAVCELLKSLLASKVGLEKLFLSGSAYGTDKDWKFSASGVAGNQTIAAIVGAWPSSFWAFRSSAHISVRYSYNEFVSGRISDHQDYFCSASSDVDQQHPTDEEAQKVGAGV